MTVAFVSCVKTKRDHSAPAKDLYISQWFLKARRYAESNSDQWFILSAAHGLLSPDVVIEPYDKSLNRMGIVDRRDWAIIVQRQMDDWRLSGERAIILAGINYRRHLVEASLRQRFTHVEIPMAGMKLGEQLSFLSKCQ